MSSVEKFRQDSHEGAKATNPPVASEAARTAPRVDVSLEAREKRKEMEAELAALKSKHDAWKQGTGPSPTIEEYHRITALARSLVDLRRDRAPLASEAEHGSLFELSRKRAKELSEKLSKRFKESVALPETITIDLPELPSGLTQAHLEAVREALGGGKGFEERVLPTLENLRNLDETYVDVMYPETQSEADTAMGLVAYRPNWWEKKASSWGVGAFVDKTTKGQAYLASMRKELETLGGSLIQLDTAVKPKYRDGKQQYGDKEGVDASADPLLPLFREAFGATANRFNHTWDDIQTKILPLAKQRIADALTAKGLSPINFDVILVPATLDNLEMTFHHPESSSTNTWELTSTTLIDDSGKDTGRRLPVGDSDDGGASYVVIDDRGNSNGNLGARLAVVWKK